MTRMMNKIYYMLIEQIGQENARKEKVKLLTRRKCAMIDEIALRIGEGGDDMLDELTDLDAELETIHDKALFRAAVSLGVELAGKRAGAGAGGGRRRVSVTAYRRQHK